LYAFIIETQDFGIKQGDFGNKQGEIREKYKHVSSKTVSRLTEQHGHQAQKGQSAATVLPARHQEASMLHQEPGLQLVLTC